MTNVAEIEELVQRYRSWLKDRTTLKSMHAGWVEITTPFLDRHNDAIQIYARKEDNSYRITDDGHTVRDLEISGCNLDIPKRKALFEIAVKGFGVDSIDDVLMVHATKENFSARKHALIQSILAVNDLFYTSSATVRSLFREDVEKWLNTADVRFLQDIPFVGKTGYVHRFDFAIPPSKVAPERLVKTFSNPNKSAAERLIFSWLDTREVRPSESVAIAMLNDNERQVSGGVIDALRQYEIEPVLWSDRSSIEPRLSA